MYLKSISETRTDPGPEGPSPASPCPGVGATREVDDATEGGPAERTDGGGGIAGDEGRGLAKSDMSEVSMASCSAVRRRDDLGTNININYCFLISKSEYSLP